MRSIVRDKQFGSNGGPTVEPAVHNLDSRQHAGESVSNLLAAERLRGRGQVAPQTEGVFGFNHAHEELGCIEKRRAINSGSGEQVAVEWLVYSQEALRRRV